MNFSPSLSHAPHRGAIRLLHFVALACMLLTAGTTQAQVSPQEELKSFRTAPGFTAYLFASEPMITNPAAIDVDTHGRVWVAEIQWYRRSAKNPPADRIKVLEDTNGDGRADKATVFADGLLSPMSLCVAGSKVYVAMSPDLWVFEDANGDLKADGPPRKLLTGFGGFNHDHGAHSLVLGPDHKWWMSHGDTGFDVTGTDGSHAKYRWGALLRGELDGSKLEIVATNFRNPYEPCISSFGEAFVSDNDNDGNESVRICWIMEGGDYGWFGTPGLRVPPGTPFGEHWHFRGYIPGFIPATLVTGFGSPTGICFYEGDAFGPHYKNTVLHTDCGPRVVRCYPHSPAGAGMKATSQVILSSQSDNYFRPDDISVAPDGRVYVSDWYDGGVGGHGYNNPDQGRIFMLWPTGKRLNRRDKPRPYRTVADAIEGLKSPNLATQYLARERLLKEPAQSTPALAALLSTREPNDRARALWVLDRIGPQGRTYVARELSSSDAAMRALAVRILRRHGAEYGKEIAKLARDSSQQVRREVLLALPGIPGASAQKALLELARTYDGKDRYLLEAINIAATGRRQELFAELTSGGEPAPAQFALLELLDPVKASDLVFARLHAPGLDPQIAKTLLESVANARSSEAAWSLLKFAADVALPIDLRRQSLDKVMNNLAGQWAEISDDPKLVDALKKLLGDKDLRGDALVRIGRLRIRQLGGHVLALCQSAQNDLDLRRRAIDVAVQLQMEEAPKVLRGLLNDPQAAVREAALGALVDLQDIRTIRTVFTEDKYSAEQRAAVADRLMTSTGGALTLLRLVEQNQVPPATRQQVLTKAAAHPDSNVRIFFEKYLPESLRPQRLGSSVTADEILALKADPHRGEMIFHRSTAAQCKNCHAVGGLGSTLGPDLGMIGKKYERKTLLQTILEPSQAIAPEYVPHLLVTDRGQVYAGFLVERTSDYVLLKDINSRLIRVAADEVEDLLPQPKSLMPELVLKDVTAQDAADLLAYLTTLKQGTQTVGMFRILGPFDMTGGTLETETPVEKSLSSPDLKAEYPALNRTTARWDLVSADGSLNFAGIDSVKYDKTKGLRGDFVAHYFLVFADSPSKQDVKLLVGSDDGCKIWINGQEVHRNPVTRGLAVAQDQVLATLNQGRNAIVMKVFNGEGRGGASLAIRATDPVVLKTE